MSQAELAAVGGVQKQSQLLYEKGERKPDSAYLSAVAEKGVDVLYVLAGRRSTAFLSSDEEFLLGGYRLLDEKGRKGVLGLIGGMTQPRESKTTMIFHGEVGQQVQGDVTYKDAVTMNVGSRRKKKSD